MFNVFPTRPLTGFPGVITRVSATEVEPRLFDPAATGAQVPLNYGFPMIYVNNYLEAFQAGNSASDIVGILARTAPTISGNLNQTFLVSPVNVVTNQNLIVRGYVNVVVADAAPVSINDPVYVRIIDSGPALIGDLESVSVPGQNELIPGYVWSVSGRDENNISELRFKV